jgi:serine/threonine protein kinase
VDNCGDVVNQEAAFQGKYPDGLKLVEDDELRDFIQLCISHTPDARPDTRKLLKHSFFEGCRGKNGDASKLDLDPRPDISTLLGAPKEHLSYQDLTSVVC